MQNSTIKIAGPQERHVIILGNGFDLYLQRKTSFADFYKSKFCPKDSNAPLIQYLNQCKRGKEIRWFDFENELLNYTKSDKFDSGVYIVSDSFKRDYEAFQQIKQGLIGYLNEITQNEDSYFICRMVNRIFPHYAKEHRIVNSFNYTTIPSIADVKPNDFHYVHGSCVKNNIIIGTREEQKLEYTYWFLQKVFDTNYSPDYTAIDLLSADKVTIFGHSLGINDRQYFDAFFKRQCDAEKAKKNMQINIYTKDEKSVMQIKRSLQELTDFHLSDLYQYSALKIITTDSFKE